MSEPVSPLGRLPRFLTAAEARTCLGTEATAGTRAGQDRQASALSLSAIETVECLFQPREIAEHHVTGMIKTVKAGGNLPALLVYWTGARAVLLDGHHRREAYRRAKAADAVPVEWFKGDLDAAIVEAGARNCRDKLPMSATERMDFAWKLVRLGAHSKAEIVEATAAADGQVATMRRVLRALQADGPEAAEDFPRWRKAREAVKGKGDWTMLTESERDARKEAQAREWTRRMGRAVGTKFANNPEIAAMALADLLGRKLPDVLRFLKDHVGEADLEEEDGNHDF